MDTPGAREPDDAAARGWDVDEVLEIACRLTGRDAIGPIHVATRRRPTYAQLLRCRQRAEACGLELTVTGSEIILRPRAGAVRPALGRPRPRTGSGRTGRPANHLRCPNWLRGLGAQARVWSAKTSTLSEGTR